MHLARACRVLTNDEIETLCGLCESMPRRLRQLVANRQIKTHMAGKKGILFKEFKRF
ncbi:hypothetical protein M885DRAFT_577188 [Pelagophyceae sp. CCMP2097]|nr:hypothetical protein M885DRAFT_577188 [Pelagophyceae sp. CCMP2097]